MAPEQCIYELGERPCACRVNDVLIEFGSAMMKQHVIELLQSGLTRDQANVMLQDEIIPAFNVWLRENFDCIMRTINDAPTDTVN
jgi:hypothetical protein